LRIDVGEEGCLLFLEIGVESVNKKNDVEIEKRGGSEKLNLKGGVC